MLINELFTKSLKWEYTRDYTTQVRAHFITGADSENEYFVSMNTQTGPTGSLTLINPNEVFKEVWSVTFTLGQGIYGIETMAGTGDAIAVFSTVLDIMVKTAKYKNIQTFSFDADNTEPSRVKLYHRLAKQFEKKGWRYIDDDELNTRNDSGENDSHDELRASGQGYSHFILTNQPLPHQENH